MITPLETKQFKAYPFLIAVMAVMQMLCILYGRHITDIFGVGVALGNIVFTPMLLYLFQIVAECYGWQYGRQIVWCNFAVNGLITIFSFAFSFVPYSDLTHFDLKYSYQDLIDKMWFSALINWITIFVIDYLATVIMCKTRNMFQGRYLVLRIFLTNIIAEAIYCSGGAFAYWYNHYTTADIMTLQYHAFIARVTSAMLLMPVALFVIWFIQKFVEQVFAFDAGSNIGHIFHWNINEKNTVKFATKEWSKLSLAEKKQLDIQKIATQYSATHILVNMKIL